MKENRIVFVDYLRVVACFLVMLVHASENFYAADASGLAGHSLYRRTDVRLLRHHHKAHFIGSRQQMDYWVVHL